VDIDIDRIWASKGVRAKRSRRTNMATRIHGQEPVDVREMEGDHRMPAVPENFDCKGLHMVVVDAGQLVVVRIHAAGRLGQLHKYPLQHHAPVHCTEVVPVGVEHGHRWYFVADSAPEADRMEHCVGAAQKGGGDMMLVRTGWKVGCRNCFLPLEDM
jgi:hypothetical protein